jgi:arylsulfatase A-like enzyme
MWPSVLLITLALTGCGGDEESAGAQGAQAEATGENPYAGLEVHEDLLARVHLAEVDHQGLFIDFGTPAHGKYTFGDWRSGWGRDGAEGGVTYTYVGRRGRVYFHADERGPMVARVRLKAIGTHALTPYMNNTQLQSLTLQDGGFRDYDVPLPAENVVRGENYFLLTFGGANTIGGEEVSVAVDSIRIVAGSSIPDGNYQAPRYDALVSSVALGGPSRPSLAMSRPTRVSFYALVPANGKLGFGAGFDGQGSAQAKVRVSPEGGQAADAWTGTVEGHFQEVVVDLASYANDVVRIDLEAVGAGAGRVVFAEPKILIPVQRPMQRAQPAKNVVVLLIDTMRADKLRPWNPRTRVRTPAIDRLAEEGTVFEAAHSPENWTKPSVASVLTGLYPLTHGARQSESVLGQRALMLSEHMKAHGFTTGSFIANGYVSDRFGFDQGWDYYTNYIREGKNTDASHVFADAGDWVEQNRDKRFFLYVQTIDPHVPYDPPEEYLRMYDAREYTGPVQPRLTADLLEKAKRNPPAVTFTDRDRERIEALHDGEVSQHDSELGRFIERLKRLGIYDDTLFVVTADHGEEFNDHGSWGHGHSVYEELLHVPLLFRMKDAIPAGRRVAQSVGTLSIPATVLQLAGVDPMPDVEGPSLLPYIDGNVPPRPSVAFSDFMDDRRVITVGRWKMIVRGNLTASIFDLEADPRERTQLEMTAHPIAARYCRILLSQFVGATNRAQWLEAAQAAGARVDSENAALDDTTRQQLIQMGYLGTN